MFYLFIYLIKFRFRISEVLRFISLGIVEVNSLISFANNANKKDEL